MEASMGKAEEVSVGFCGLFDRASSTAPDRPRSGRVIEPAEWLAEALTDAMERLGDRNRFTSEANDR
jgi:hypothetical protein